MNSADRKWLWIGAALVVVMLAIAPFLVKNYRVFPVQPGAGLRRCRARAEHPDRFQWPDLARAWRVLCDRSYAAAMLMDRLGLPYWATLPLAGLLCFVARLPDGIPGAAAGRPLPGTGHFRACAGGAAAAEVQEDRRLHRRRAGHRAGQARAAIHLQLSRPAAQRRSLAVLLHAGGDRDDVPAGLEPAARSRWSRAVAIRDHPVAATAMGINLPMFKSLTFGVSAAFTGVAGALGAIAVSLCVARQFHRPAVDDFCWLASWLAGWPRSQAPFFGAIFIQFVPNIADELSKSAPGGDLRRVADRSCI